MITAPGDIRQSPKIALNVDIRDFQAEKTEVTFFIDPANTYYYDDELMDTSLGIIALPNLC